MGPWPVAIVVYGRSLTLRSAVSTERALGRLHAAQARSANANRRHGTPDGHYARICTLQRPACCIQLATRPAGHSLRICWEQARVRAMGPGAHKAVVVEAVVRGQRLQLGVERVVCAVVRAKRVAGEHHACTAQHPRLTCTKYKVL